MSFYHVPDRGGFIALKACTRPARSLTVCQFISEIAVRSVESKVLFWYMTPVGLSDVSSVVLAQGFYMRRYLVKQRLRLRLMRTRHQVSSVLAAETTSPVCDPVNFRLLLAMRIIYTHHELRMSM